VEAVTWRHPEWWSLGLSVGAWLLLATTSASAGDLAAAHHHAGSAAAAITGLTGGMAATVLTGSAAAWIPGVLGWLTMVVAMMVPLVLAQIRFAAARSLWRRRHRAIVGFLVGYLGTWLVVGLGAVGLSVALQADDRVAASWVAALGFVVAAAWQLSPIKWRALRGCDRTNPLAPHGWRADRDCVRYGWLVGGQCLLSCWALMLACMLAGHGVLALAGVTIVTAAERYLARPDQRIVCGLLAGLAVVYAIV
jgi:predicted metal-binding membrane protein